MPLPTTHKAFVAKLLNPTNTNSLSSILPAPPAVSLSLKHAYVSIASLIAYDLGVANASVDPPYNVKFQRLVDSEHGQKLFLRAKEQLAIEEAAVDAPITSYISLVVLFLMWFDGWDPNSSSKSNRSPVWSGSLTLVFVNLQGGVVSVSTYPFAAGPGKGDHEVIYQQIVLDVRAMQAPLDNEAHHSRWFYSRMASQMALVCGELFCIWQDQPARRQETYLLGGNSNNHAIFGTSCFVQHLQTPVAACTHCRHVTQEYLCGKMFQTALITHCSSCTNWRFPEDPNASPHATARSEAFPTDAVAGREFNRGGG